jgi:hypothetical protein
MYDMDCQPSPNLLHQVGELLGNVCNVDEVGDQIDQLYYIMLHSITNG